MREVGTRKILAFSFLLFLSALGAWGCGCEPEPVVETWTGPGRQDGRVEPIRPEEDGVHLLEDEDYVEHWYFDARLDNGYLVVGFLWASEMQSRKPAMELHIYLPSGEKRSATRSFDRSAFRASTEKCDVRVGGNRAYASYPEGGGLPVYHLFLAEGDLEADLTFHGEVPGWKPGGGRTEYGREGFFAWVVPLPRARVEGSVRIGDERLAVQGIGYHDHNWETVDLKKVVSYWYWGRIYAEDFTLLYAYVKTNRRFGGVASSPVMLAHRDRIVYSTGEMRLEEGSPVFHDGANRSYPATLGIEVPGRISLQLEVQDVIDAHDFLEAMHPALKRALNAFWGRPGWFRFRSRFELEARIDGTAYEREGTTLHEMVALR